jgi:fructokinase
VILVVGESLVDIVVRSDGRRSEHPGGSPANVAVGLGRLGHPVTLATSLGDDERGKVVRAALERSHVEIAPGSISAAPTSTATAWLDARGAARYDFDITWDPAGLDTVPIGPLVHTGSIAAYLGPGADAVEALVQRASETALVTFDPNIRPRLLDDRDAVLTRLTRLMASCGVVKVSDEDLDWLYPGIAPTAIARTWIELGAGLVVITAGARGSFAVHAAGEVHVASSTTPVIDTVGAGDSYMSGLIDAMTTTGLVTSGSADPAAGVRGLSLSDLRSYMHHANISAAITVGRAGAEPPTRDELPPIAARA